MLCRYSPNINTDHTCINAAVIKLSITAGHYEADSANLTGEIHRTALINNYNFPEGNNA